jgi:hypothetical protein
VTTQIDASRGAVARKTGRLPPGEHLVELRARAMPDQMVLRIAGYSVDLQAGTVVNLDKLFANPPSPDDGRATRAYAAQGGFWLALLAACGIEDSELQNITLAELAEKISGRRAIAVISENGFWNRVRAL